MQSSWKNREADKMKLRNFAFVKILAKELNILPPLLQFRVQLNRDDKRPMLSFNLRESGAIEQDADMVMFLS